MNACRLLLNNDVFVPAHFAKLYTNKTASLRYSSTTGDWHLFGGEWRGETGCCHIARI